MSLNPILTIGSQIKESLRLRRAASATNNEVVRLLQLVGISSPETRIRNYPHEISGGMQQRAMIAMALASRPKLLVADEPTTALDATIQAQIIELLRDLKRDLGMAILLITHNLGIVSDFADRVAVMYSGQIVETSTAGDLLRHPLHPYTRALLDSVPRLGAESNRLASIPGTMPRLGEEPPGCRFHPRCAISIPECSGTPPTSEKVPPGRLVRCPRWLKDPHGHQPLSANPS